MNLKSLKLIFISTVTIFAVAILSASWLFYYKWENASFHPAKVIAYYQTSQNFSQLQSHPISRIGKLASDGLFVDAQKELKKLEEVVRTLGPLSNSFEMKKLMTSLTVYEVNVGNYAKASAYQKSELSLREEVKALTATFKARKYVTLSKAGELLDNYLSMQTSFKKSGLDRATRLDQNVTTTVRRIKEITEKSTLAQGVKNEIIAKLGSILTHSSHLVAYAKEQALFENGSKVTEQLFDGWVQRVAAESTLGQIKVSYFTKDFFVMCAMALGIFALLLTTMIFTLKFLTKKVSQEIEEKVVDLLKENLLAQNKKAEMPFVHQTKEFGHLCDYVHKRMSFGTIFQDSLPFPSLLLNSNLSMVWANKHFFENWDITLDGLQYEAFSWDYLSKIISLGEHDPVIEAINNRISGIYQIQLKREGMHEAQAFEMYVTPVDYQDQKRVMLLFYPMTAVEKTISNISKSLTGPVKHTLDALIEGEYNDHFIDESLKDYQIAGIEEIHASFELNFRKTKKALEFLEYENDKLNFELINRDQMLSKIAHDVRELSYSYSEVTKGFRTTRDHLVEIVGVRSDIEQLAGVAFDRVKSLAGLESDLIDGIGQQEAMLGDCSHTIKDLGDMRYQIKQTYEQVAENRAEVARGIEQAIVIARSEKSARNEHLLMNVKERLRSLEPVFTQFSGQVRTLDVLLAKLDMLLHARKVVSVNEIHGHVENFWQEIDNSEKQLCQASARAERLDDGVIGGLKSTYEQYRSGEKHLRNVQESLLDYLEGPNNEPKEINA